MSYQFQLTVPIRSHFKKMVAKRHIVEPFKLSSGRCHYSQIFFGNLHKNYIKAKPKHPDYFNTHLTIEFNSDLSRENRFYWDAQTVNSIDKALESLFNDKLFTYLDDHAQGKGDIQNGIIKFMECYAITEDDIKLDSLKKKYYRYRTNQEKHDKRNFRALAENQNSFENQSPPTN